MAHPPNYFAPSGEGVISIGTQAWNIADGFTKIKILRILIQLDIDEEIAMFGKKDEFDNPSEEEIPYRRVESFKKFIFHLRQVIGNCQFTIEKGVDEKIIIDLLERIDTVEKYSDGICDYMINDVTKENVLVINEEHFRKSFNALKSVKDTLNFPVNRAGIIFKQTDELDLDDMMRDIEEGG